jgi:hypothetical protein
MEPGDDDSDDYDYLAANEMGWDGTELIGDGDSDDDDEEEGDELAHDASGGDDEL